jgi:hypothetical protein
MYGSQIRCQWSPTCGWVDVGSKLPHKPAKASTRLGSYCLLSTNLESAIGRQQLQCGRRDPACAKCQKLVIRGLE